MIIVGSSIDTLIDAFERMSILLLFSCSICIVSTLQQESNKYFVAKTKKVKVGTLYQVSKIMFDYVLNKVILEHFKHLSQQLMPSCDLPTVLPDNFMTETIKINRSTSLHDLIQIKPVHVSLSGPIPYELNAVKYTVKCEINIQK